MFDAADLREIYAETGDPVVHTSAQTGTVTYNLRGLFSRVGLVAFGEVQTTHPSLRYSKADFPTVVRGDIFTIAGARWRVQQAPTLVADGHELSCDLEAAP